MSTLAPVSAVDLAACDREPIHIPGLIQSHGALFACRAGSTALTHVSEGAFTVCGLAPAPLGSDLTSVLGKEVVAALQSAAPGAVSAGRAPPEASHVRVFGVPVGAAAQPFDISLHDYNGMRIVEFEKSGPGIQTSPLELVRNVLTQLQQARTLRDLCDHSVHLIRDLIGFDRVMIYRFLEDGAGQVIAESREDDMEPMLNLRYPASDIPRQARELYKRNAIRLIADVAAVPAALICDSAEAGTPLDLSFAALRSVSPVHIEYLRNMKVGASMSISIIVGGELWGLIACHHKTARHVPANVRAAAELLGQVFSLQIQTVEGIEAYVAMRAARALLDRIVAEFPVDGDLFENIAQRLEPLSAFISCDGAGLWMDGVWRSVGVAPGMTEMAALARMAGSERAGEVFATQRLADMYPRAKVWPHDIAGVLAVPLSHSGGDFLFFFRKEVAQTIDWGGDPEKPAEQTGAQLRLTPRKSFDAWRQDVRGQSLPWTSRERLIADTLRVYLLDIIVRFSEVILDERRKSNQRARVITSELNHRVKGTLELIQSLVTRGQDATSVSAFVRTLEGRIGAIALAHSAISSSEGAQIKQLVESAISAVAPLPDQFEAQGPETILDAKAYTVLALVLHELATNALQHGALSLPQGHVAVRWHRDSAQRLVLSWQESGAVPIRPVAKEGLGLNIVRRNIPHALGGEAGVTFERNGIAARFVIPARFVHAHPLTEPAPSARLAHNAYGPLEGFSLLVLDDQMLVAMDLQDGLKRCGAGSVEIAGTVETALAAIEKQLPDAAVLDVDLDDATSFAVADHLEQLSVPFLFMANDVERRLIPPRFDNVPVAGKPCAPEVLADMLRDALMPNLIRAVLNKLV